MYFASDVPPTGRDHPSTLQHGRMEGWVRIRIAGQTDWKKVWMSVTAAADAAPNDAPTSAKGPKKRMSNLFSKDNSSPDTPLPPKPVIAMFAGPKPKDRRRPVLTFHNVTQAFAVYPERPDLISRSTLIKLEGLIGDEETAGDMGRREGWLLIMPELEGGLGQAEEMLKWIVGSSTSVFFSLYATKSFLSTPRRIPTLWTAARMDMGSPRPRVTHVCLPRWASPRRAYLSFHSSLLYSTPSSFSSSNENKLKRSMLEMIAPQLSGPDY
jgi:hypothetical protein